MRRDQTVHERLVPLLVNIIGAKCYLELGVYTFNTIRKVKKYNPDCRCVGVDMKWHCPTPPGIEFHLSTTDHFFVHNADGLEPDVVFIDADHSADSVRRDFKNAWDIVVPDGIILLHDGNPEREEDTASGYCGDAWLAIRDITEASSECKCGHPLSRHGIEYTAESCCTVYEHDCECDHFCPTIGRHEAVTLPFHPGISIVRKRVKWGPAG